ncbi:chaperone protein DnaJ [bacterium BMS3Abin05]|nr:chaperone protein DnaJ [bacterium BMS3Abin05]GBE28891.1 chaperone protein DnaJ [bacterium BMS3Bbin03]
MAHENLYLILGVDRNADQETIKKVYRELVKKYHPDKGADRDEERLKKVNEAYSVLSNKEKRASYNLTLDTAPGAQEKHDVRPQNLWDLILERDDFLNDFWEFPFRGSVSGRRDLSFEVFLEAGQAGKKASFQIQFPEKAACSSCRGSGWTGLGVCSVCRGRGYLVKSRVVDVEIPESVREGFVQTIGYSADSGNDYVIHLIYHIE